MVCNGKEELSAPAYLNHLSSYSPLTGFHPVEGVERKLPFPQPPSFPPSPKLKSKSIRTLSGTLKVTKSNLHCSKIFRGGCSQTPLQGNFLHQWQPPPPPKKKTKKNNFLNETPINYFTWEAEALLPAALNYPVVSPTAASVATAHGTSSCHIECCHLTSTHDYLLLGCEAT